MGFFDKLKKINIFAGFGSELTDDFYDELEESLILADTGMDVTLELVEELRRRVKSEGVKTVEGAREVMVRVIADALSAGELSLDLSTKPSVVLFIGVNGVGKTTTGGSGKRYFSAPPTPSGPPLPTSSPSGPTGPGWTSSSSRRGPTPPPWFSTPCLPPRPGIPMWSWWTPPAGSTTSRIS